MRQIVLDTETTGLEPSEGHRVIEIGCLELIDRRITGSTYHQYINPNRTIDKGALAVHGITEDFLVKQPVFKEIAPQFLEFVQDAQLIIHNAPFDVGFLNHELQLINKKHPKLTEHCTIIDTLAMARQLHPGQRNSLDALCKRYNVTNSHRKLHGALIDAELLALVYLAMTGGQASLFSDDHLTVYTDITVASPITTTTITLQDTLPIIKANSEELSAHQARLEAIEKKAKDGSIWNKE